MKRVISVSSRHAAVGDHSGTCSTPETLMRDTRVFSPFVDAFELRGQFPVLGCVAYLNAGTDGPLPARAVRAAGEELEREARDGRALSHFERRFALAGAVGPRTRLVACSHVGWMSGLEAPKELAQLDVPVLLDGAQGVGAVEVDVGALGCDAYAGAAQKWLCGPDGAGMLYVRASLRERLAVSRRRYAHRADPHGGI